MTQTEALIWRYVHGNNQTEHLKPLTVRLIDPSSNPRHPLPLGILVPTSAEPALLVVMPNSGKVTYWESLSSATNVDPYRQKQQSVQGAVSGLLSGEIVIKITEAEPRGFVLTMSTGRLAHLMVSDPQGKPAINVQFMRDSGAQSGGVFGSLRSVFSSAGWRKDVAAVRAGTSKQRGQRSVVVTTTKGSFQIWDLNWNGTHSLINEVEAKEDMLQALIEGAETPQNIDEHIFEVLDFTLLPDVGSGQEIATLKKSGDCKLMVLTSLKGTDSTKYALIGITLTSKAVNIDVVHPITCFRASLPSESTFRPQILVPEPGQTAFVVFETSIVLISLVELDENPSSQLQMEAHTLPEPFQDVIDFRKTKPYRVVGCAPELYDHSHTPSSCVLMVFGFGLVRVSALPTKQGQSAFERTAVTVATRIEQAVFFGNLQQDLLDFTPRPEMTFDQEEVEAAALNIARSIMDSSSPYVVAIAPSMEQTLQQRATALAELNMHLTNHYPPLSRLTRWKLLWNAEKMASAKAIWRCYTDALNNPNKGSDNRTLLAQLVEYMHQSLKNENQPDLHQTDGVRHWFIHDVWRLENIIPWAQEIVEALFEESVEDNAKIDQATQARFVSEANDIQLAGLETAFEFRQNNAAAYGLGDERMVDGILKGGYEELPQIWTSTQFIVEKVKTLTDVARELAKLNGDSDGSDGDPSPQLVMKLAKDNPRQVQLCCLTYIERYRWLKSRPDAVSRAAGERLMHAHFEVRRNLFASLSDIGQPELGIKLAEKYHDMDALVQIIEQEIDSAESDEVTQQYEDRVDEYFVKFGTHWATAFFKSHLDGGDAAEVLNSNTSYRKHLTHFFRHHPEYAKVAWINEVAVEQNYLQAATHLERARAQERNLWSCKIALSMAKLSIMAASAKSQIENQLMESTMEGIDGQLPMMTIQGDLYRYIKSTVRDALDADAEADLAMQRYGSGFVKGKPFLRDVLDRNLRTMLAMETLPLESLIDVLTLIDGQVLYSDDGFQVLDSRFFSALRILRQSTSQDTDPGRLDLLEKIIWRRCMIHDNWEEINRTELKDDNQVELETGITSLFKTIKEGYRNGLFERQPPPSPTTLLEAGTTVESLKNSPSYKNLPENTLSLLARDLEKESELLEEYLENGRLEEWSKGVNSAAKAAARAEADEEGNEKLRKREEKLELKARMKATDREAFPQEDDGPEWFEYRYNDRGDTSAMDMS